MDSRKEKPKARPLLNRMERRRRIDQAVAQGKSSEQIISQEGISPRTLARDRKAVLTAKTRVYDPLDSGIVWDECQNKLREYESKAKEIIKSQENLDTVLAAYLNERREKAHQKGRCSLPKPDVMPNHNTVLRALEFLVYMEKTRIAIGQEIGIISKGGGFGPNWKMPELPGGGNGEGRIAERIEKLPPQKRMKVIARLREVAREVKILKED